MGTPWLRPNSTARSCSTRAPEPAISSISIGETAASRRAPGTMRGSAREDAVDVGVDLAVAVERGGQRDRGRVRSAAAEGGDVVGGRDALEAGHEHDLVPLERLVDPAWADLDDLGLRVHRVGDDARLRAGERHGVVAEVCDRHRAQRRRDALAGREQHVHLARVRPGRHLLGEVDQLVGGVAHRRDDPDDAAAGHRARPPGARPRAGSCRRRRRTCPRTSSRARARRRAGRRAAAISAMVSRMAAISPAWCAG